MQKITLRRVLLFSISLLASIMLLVGLSYTVIGVSFPMLEGILGLNPEEAALFTTNGFDLLEFEINSSFVKVFNSYIFVNEIKHWCIVLGVLSFVILLFSVSSIIVIVVCFFKMGDKKATKTLLALFVLGTIIIVAYSVVCILFVNSTQSRLEILLAKEPSINIDIMKIDEYIKLFTSTHIAGVVQIILFISFIICLLMTKEGLSKGKDIEIKKIANNKVELEDLKNSIENLSTLLKDYKKLSEEGLINTSEYLNKMTKINDFYVQKSGEELSLISKMGRINDVLIAEAVGLKIIKEAKELLEQGYITTENYLSLKTMILNSVII